MNFNSRSVFAGACLGMLLFGIVFISLGTVLTFIATKFHLSELEAGTLTTLLPGGILAGSLIFGPLVDRFGYKYILIISAFIIFASLESISIAEEVNLLRINFFTIGLGGGIINGATNALVADISETNKGANLSLLGIFYGIGAIGMPVLMVLLISHFSYEQIISGISFIILVPLFYFVAIRFPKPKMRHGLSVKKASDLFSASLLLLGVILFFESAFEGITNNWITSFASKELGLKASAALTALTLLNVSLVLSRIGLSFLLKKYRQVSILYAGFLLLLIGAVLLLSAHNNWMLFAGVIFIGLGFGPGFPVVLSYVSELYPAMTGTAFGIVITIALIGNTAVNSLVGVLAQSQGIGVLPFVMMFCGIAMILILRIVLKRIESKVKEI